MTSPVMNGALLDPFRHNAWATQQLLDVCGRLSADRLSATTTGAYASILETFNHIIMAEARYARRLTGTALGWLDSSGSDPGDVDVHGITIGDLVTRAGELAQLWETFLSQPDDSEREISLDDGAYQTHAGVLVAQTLHHGNVHREQICAILTAAGVEPPDLQPWAYASATGRAREAGSGESA